MKQNYAFVAFWLLMALNPLDALGSQEPKVEALTFTTEDGIPLTGTLTGSGTKVVILSNQHHVTEFLWDSFVPDLVGAGWSVFTYNYRGIGTSGGQEDVPQVGKDLRAAHQLIRSRGATRIALVGASLGSMVTLAAAPELKPAAVVLLSVGRSFFGLNLAPDPSQGVDSPTLLVTSEYDFSRGDTEAIAGQFGRRAELLVVPASDHGTALLDGPYAEEVRAKVLGFLKSHLK